MLLIRFYDATRRPSKLCVLDFAQNAAKKHTLKIKIRKTRAYRPTQRRKGEPWTVRAKKLFHFSML